MLYWCYFSLKCSYFSTNLLEMSYLNAKMSAIKPHYQSLLFSTEVINLFSGQKATSTWKIGPVKAFLCSTEWTSQHQRGKTISVTQTASLNTWAKCSHSWCLTCHASSLKWLCTSENKTPPSLGLYMQFETVGFDEVNACCCWMLMNIITTAAGVLLGFIMW